MSIQNESALRGENRDLDPTLLADIKPTTVNLLPCPWCGNEPDMFEGDSNCEITCWNEGCPATASSVEDPITRNAIKRWNTRMQAAVTVAVAPEAK